MKKCVQYKIPRPRRMNLFALISLVFILLGINVFFKAGYCQDNPPTKMIRVAILDNPNLSDNVWMWLDYEKIYLSGMEVAKLAAKKQHVQIEYKSFFYGNQPLDILKQIPKVQAWHPDLILGPHYSNQFLLLRKYFPRVLVLSSYASDPEIEKLPINFYSLSTTDDSLIHALTGYINAQFPNKDVFMIVQSDCKDCNDMAALLKENYKRLNSKVKISETGFIGNKIENLNIATLMQNYHEGDLIFLEPVTYYAYLNLMPRIVAFLKKPHIVFFTPLDSWGEADAAQKSLGPVPSEQYDGYRINSLLLDDTSDRYATAFKQLFFERYKKSPMNTLSYTTFLAVMSVITALQEFPEKNQKSPMWLQIINSFKRALDTDPNWFRPTQYGVYQYSSHSLKQKEMLVKVLPAFGSKENG